MRVPFCRKLKPEQRKDQISCLATEVAQLGNFLIPSPLVENLVYPRTAYNLSNLIAVILKLNLLLTT